MNRTYKSLADLSEHVHRQREMAKRKFDDFINHPELSSPAKAATSDVAVPDAGTTVEVASETSSSEASIGSPRPDTTAVDADGDHRPPERIGARVLRSVQEKRQAAAAVKSSIRRTTLPPHAKVSEPLYGAPAPIDPVDIVMDVFRLKCLFSDVCPAEVDAVTEPWVEELLAEDVWHGRPKNSFWIPLYRRYWDVVEQRILAAPSLEVKRQRLAMRLCIVASIFDSHFTPTMFDKQVSKCVCEADVVKLWREALQRYSVLPSGIPTEAPGKRVIESTSQTLHVTLLLWVHGVDMTVLFASDNSRLKALKVALEADVHDALRPADHNASCAANFHVSATRMDHGVLVHLTLTMAKLRSELQRVAKRIERHIEDGRFDLSATRDVLLNMMGHPVHAVKVFGASLQGVLTVPPDMFDVLEPQPLPLAPLMLDMRSFERTLASAGAKGRSGPGMLPPPPPVYPAPRTFLDTVWQPQPEWDAAASRLPPYGTELPKPMQIASLSLPCAAVVPSEGSMRARDGSLLSPSMAEFFKRRTPLLL